ncbi:MAG: aminoglycoside phosphotransferase family protein, partial [Chitinophagaceae bacterium]|nr:aminoglycoside phosphotransferase family protein [Chitinophagaceae bacterium]
MHLTDILKKFCLENYFVRPFGNGLINNTWIVENSKGGKEFILQKINQNIFKSPQDIAFNIRLVADHLQHNHPDYLFTGPMQSVDGKDLIKSKEEYFRLFPFVKNSHTID